MGQMVFEPLQSWELGAHATPAQDMGPKGSFPLGENTVLLHNTGATAVVGQREGWGMQNALPQPGATPILGMYDYIRATGPLQLTSAHLVVGTNGRLDKLLADMTIAVADASRPIPFTPGTYPPSFSTMNNLCFIANGIDKLQVFNGTKVYDAGLPAPPLPGVQGGAGVMPAGIYSFLVTYYDQTSGLESSASPTQEINLGVGQVTVSWTPYAGAHPYTHTRVYMRQDAKQTEHFLAAEVAVPATSTVINLTQDQLDALTILAPDEFENNPPPLGLVGIRAHVSRMFAHDGSKVYYSNLDAPEAWDPDNHFSVNTDDGQRITALFAAHEVLIVFKRDSVWALYGEDPSTWTPRMISPSVGCINERSILYIEGQSYWWSERGPMSWTGSGPVENLALGRIDDQVTFEMGLDTQAASPNPPLGYVGVVATVDVVNQRILWAMPSVNSKQNNIILPYKYRFNQWEATQWFGMDAASLASIQDAKSTPYVFLGGYKGQIFRYGEVSNDGTPTGAIEGQVGSATLTTLTIAEGTLLTTGNGLAERYLYVNNGTPEGWQIKRIGSNTATTITLALNQEFTLIPNAAWTWSVGTIGFRVMLPWHAFTSPFIRKRLEYGYFWLGGNLASSLIDIQLYRNYNMDAPVRTFILPLEASGLVWSEGKWDEELWGGGITVKRFRRRLAKVCFTYRWLFRQYKPNTNVVLYKVDTRAETQVDKT